MTGMRRFAGERWQLTDGAGQRKYLTIDERGKFLEAAARADRFTRTLCLLLAHTGARLSEALQLTADRVRFDEKTVVIRTLKKAGSAHHRAVPVPDALLDSLDLVHDIRGAQKSRGKGRNVRLWQWHRSTAWRRICSVMAAAGVEGPHATPKGLRHCFGIAAVQAGIPLNMVQKWLGHANLSTTAVYADATGDEERELASRMWGNG